MINVIDFLLFKARFRHYSKEKIEAYQRKRAKRIVDYAIGHSAFFRERCAGIDDLSLLPTTDKRLMMDNLTAYNTLGLRKEELVAFALEIEKSRDFTRRFKGINIGMSSGTSGNKGIIITTRKEEEYLKTMYLSRLTLPKGEKLNGAFILRVFSPAFSFHRFGHKLTYVNQLQPLEGICEDLQSINPNVISSPPSMLKVLAKEVQKGTLKVTPKLIYCYAETLYPDVKHLLEQAFHCPILQVYQGSEGCHAISCREGRLHINEDIVLLELQDEKGNPTEDGSPCHRLLVTDLHKRSQPIIRYAINDIITISREPCPCGSNFRVIQSIQGRADDMLWGNKNGKRHFIFPDYVVRAIIASSDGIDDFQVIQKSLTAVSVNLMLISGKKDKRIARKVASAVQTVFKRYGCALPKITVTFKKPKPNTRSNKLSRVLCEVKKA